MRWLIGVAGLLLLFVIAVPVTAIVTERWLRGAGLDRVRQELASALKVGVDALDLEIEAPWLLPAVLGRRDAQVRLSARDVPAGDTGAVLRELTVHLDDVRGHGGLRPTGVVVGGGLFSTTIDERELPIASAMRGLVTRIEVRPGELRLWTIGAVPVDAAVELTDTEVIVDPDPMQLTALLDALPVPGLRAMRRLLPQARWRFPIPSLPLGARIEDIRLSRGAIHVQGIVPAQTISQTGSATASP